MSPLKTVEPVTPVIDPAHLHERINAAIDCLNRNDSRMALVILECQARQLQTILAGQETA